MWEIAAPTMKPVTVTAESVLPSPARISWRRGHPPSSTEPQPTSTMPSRFHSHSVWAMGWSVKPGVNFCRARLPISTARMMAAKAEISRKSRNSTASRMPPTMHSRER